MYVETCPQYLALDDGVYYDPDFSSAARDVCAPPIRSQEDSEALWKALRRGEVQTFSTDHCSFTLEQKDTGRDDFTMIPGGLPGVETRGEVVYTVAINENKLSLGGVCRALSENPAKLYGLYPRKGGSAAGSVVSYCLGITDVDPVQYNLYFERFLNPERVSMPDIDVDFDDDGRFVVFCFFFVLY